MKTLQKKLKRLGRKRAHLKFLKNRIWELKYEILNEALHLEVNKNKVKIFHKYQKRLKLITFFK